MRDCLNITLLIWVAAVSLALLLSQKAVVVHSCYKSTSMHRVKWTIKVVKYSVQK